MNRENLDAFFAKAEDVLTDWHGGTDAMHARVPDGEVDELAPHGESYYEQAQTRLAAAQERYAAARDRYAATMNQAILDGILTPPRDDGNGTVTYRVEVDTAPWEDAWERIAAATRRWPATP